MDAEQNISNPVAPETIESSEATSFVEENTNVTSSLPELQERATNCESGNSGPDDSQTESGLIETRTENEDNTNLEANKIQDSFLKDGHSSEEEISEPMIVEEQRSEPTKADEETSEPMDVEEDTNEPTTVEENIVDGAVREQQKVGSEAVEEHEKVTTENEEVTAVGNTSVEQENITENKEDAIADIIVNDQERITTENEEDTVVDEIVNGQEKIAIENKEVTTVENTMDVDEKTANENEAATTVEKTVTEPEKTGIQNDEITNVEKTVVEQNKKLPNVTVPSEIIEKEPSKPEENVEDTPKSVEGKEIIDNLNEGEKKKSTTGSGEKEKRRHEQVEQNGEEENRENPVFVHVNSGKEDDGKSDKSAEQEQEDEDFQNSQPKEDPIAADSAAVEDPKETIEDSEQGADEELCIIPDTERVISQEEKDAASALLPIQTDVDITEVDSGDQFLITTCLDDSMHSCIQCLLPRKASYISTAEQRTLYICDDNCLNAFKEDHPGKVITRRLGDLRVKNLTPECSTPNNLTTNMDIFIRKCAECARPVSVSEECTLSWETMDFCNEICLSKYQKKIASNCSYCAGDVRAPSLGKYAVRFGYDIRQFCSGHCLEEYKKGLKVCSYCQKDISVGTDGFLAPAGDKGQFKDFCSPVCMDKYNNMNSRKQPVVCPGVSCCVCLKEVPISIEYEQDGKMNLFCGDPCFVAYKFVNHIVPGKCDMCGRYFDFKVLEQHTVFYDDTQHSFCSKSCQNIYIIANRRIVPCSWCKVKKYNFDMIKRRTSAGQTILMCSLNCLGLHQVSINALSLKKSQCDHCGKTSQPMYHLTMSDATTRNFCSYNCVMTFQNQYSKRPLTLNEPETLPVPTGAPKRSRRTQQKEMELPALPIISNVQSLAPLTNGTSVQLPPLTPAVRSTRSKPTAPTIPILNTTTPIKQYVLIKPAPVPDVKNVMTMCKPLMIDQSLNTNTDTDDKGNQTDDVQNHPRVIVLPVPIYVPVPLPMMVAPYPQPTPFPVPVPVPVFIPTTRNSANGILKEIKKIQVKIPTDPFEAELLMMAEMVAGDKKEEHTDSESEEEDTTAPPDDPSFSPEPVDASNSFGDDMLQMALKMASELDEPAVDLEGALTASTITASQGTDSSANDENVDDPQPISQIISRQGPTYSRGKKRAARGKGGPSKRGRRSSHTSEVPTVSQQQSNVPVEPTEKPDANMCLKYTFGVNAWKQWVTTKNAELEKSSRRVKLFKPEILQLTADELNYSLCLFVKEVRKPNGAEYAPDTIYYLCLGIQQYLFENGRIDNIFCDAYYEKFTDCLDEVARKFSVLYNDSHYIVTRVEEEHLWESKQLGAHSPHVLLSTLMFFNTKHFNLTSVDEHMQLSFSHIMKHWKRSPNQPGTVKSPGSRNVLLRFYPPQTAIVNNRKKKVYEQQENEENPLRCPVKLYEFYLSKCPESVKTRNDVFYLLPERSCVPDSPVWYSTMALPREALEKMLHRVKMVKEINVALLTS